MAYRIFWTPIAVRDLSDICDFISRDNLVARSAWVKNSSNDRKGCQAAQVLWTEEKLVSGRS